MTFRFLSADGMRYLKSKLQQMITAAVSAVTPAQIGASAASHTHDSRYYTVEKVDAALDKKAKWGGAQSGVNIGTLHRAGFYGIYGNCTDLPVAGTPGYLVVLDYRGTDSWGAQLFIAETTPQRMFFRTAAGATGDAWNNWANAGDYSGSSISMNGSGYLHLKMGDFGELMSSPNDSSLNLRFNGGVFVMNKANSAMVPVHASSFVTSSSRKYKEHIVPLSQTQAQALLDFQIVQYDYIAGEKNQFGVIAEDVAKIQHQGVYFDAENAPDAVDYSKFVPQIIALCQSQQKQIDTFETRVSALENLKVSKTGGK